MHCIAGYALSRVIHRIQSGTFIGNPDWYIEWLGTVDRRYPAWYSDLITPPFCGNPPTIWDVMRQGMNIAGR
jgi:hypothetical protein